MLITVRNDGEVPVVLGNNCGGRWMSLEQAGKPMRWDRTCQCECGSTACGCPAACFNTQKLLLPGQSEQLEWDGTYLSYDDPSCYKPAVPKTGSTLTARICWNPTNDNPTGTCGSREFRYGTDQKLELAIKAVPEPRRETKIVLENHTGGPIEVLKICGAPSWFELDMGKEITLNSLCVCDCSSSFMPSTCPNCGACSPDVPQTIADGASVSQIWDGRFSFNRPGCSSRYDMPASLDVLAKVCWRKQGSTQQVCSPLRFQSGQSAPVAASAR